MLSVVLSLKICEQNSEAEEKAFLCCLITPMLLSTIKEDMKQCGRNISICYDWLLTITSKANNVSQSVMSELAPPGEYKPHYVCFIQLKGWMLHMASMCGWH